MNNKTQMIIDDLENLAHDASALVEATANVAEAKVEKARERVAVGINKVEEFFSAARRKTMGGSHSSGAILHDNLYPILAVGVIAGALIGTLLTARGACRRN